MEQTTKRQYPSYRNRRELQGSFRQLELPYERLAKGLHVQATSQEGSKARIKGEYGDILHFCCLGTSALSVQRNVANSSMV
jgi:hypothetical protein